LRIGNLIELLQQGKSPSLENTSKGLVVETRMELSSRLREILRAGGLLAYSREKGKV
jgi:hypothetical protein